MNHMMAPGVAALLKDERIEGASMLLMEVPCLVMHFVMVPLKGMLELELQVIHSHQMGLLILMLAQNLLPWAAALEDYIACCIPSHIVELEQGTTLLPVHQKVNNLN